MKSLPGLRHLPWLILFALLAFLLLGTAPDRTSLAADKLPDRMKVRFIPERNVVNLTDKGVPLDINGKEDCHRVRARSTAGKAPRPLPSTFSGSPSRVSPRVAGLTPLTLCHVS